MSISSRFFKFLYCLENEQWFLPFNYPLFQIHFPTDSLFYLNIISSFILYSLFIHFLTFIHLPILLYSITNYYNIKKHLKDVQSPIRFDELLFISEKNSNFRESIKDHFFVLLSVIENILPLTIPLEISYALAAIETNIGDSDTKLT